LDLDSANVTTFEALYRFEAFKKAFKHCHKIGLGYFWEVFLFTAYNFI